jgi:hypothetical protein
MILKKFDVVKQGLADESEAPRGRDIYYRCGKCGDFVVSQPNANVGCQCGNIFIDNDYVRLVVDDLSQFQVVRNVHSHESDARACSQ